ncbi:MAG: sigma-70 family RNA polymerase sigma factor [Ruminococcaceae bacterium]|nr:sigma-70 family RNA polymerase sigma factor [Oscillospiraceae bacterium]
MEFTFEPSPWELAVDKLRAGDKISAMQCLHLLEELSEAEGEEALLSLEEKGVALDISDLPKSSGTGAAAVRLNLEQKLVEKGELLTGLAETDPLRLYLEELADMQSTEDAEQLAAQYAAGDDSVTQQLVNLSLNRVVESACQMTGRGVLLLDLIQEGSLGLWQGLLHYQGGNYVNHITWWIHQYLAKAVLLQASSSDIGQKLRRGMEDYQDMDQKLLVELGRNPTVEEIAEAIHVTVEEANTYASVLAQARLRQQVDSVRAPKEETPDDQHAVEDTAYFQMRQRILELLSTLSQQEAKLLTLRFGLEGGAPMTPQQTGEALGLTPDEVVQIETAALQKLRQQ